MCVLLTERQQCECVKAPRTLLRRSKARARHSSWRWPTEKFSPFSTTDASSLPGKFSIYTRAHAKLSGLHLWRKMSGGRSESCSQVKPSNCFRRLEKLVKYLPLLTQVLHPWWCETCRVTHQQFWMKECDIFRGGGKKYSDPSYIFSGGQDPNAPGKLLVCRTDISKNRLSSPDAQHLCRIFQHTRSLRTVYIQGLNSAGSRRISDPALLFGD